MSNGALLHQVWPAARRATLRVVVAATLCAVALTLERLAGEARQEAAAEAARARAAAALNQRLREVHLIYAARYAQLRTRGHIGATSRAGLLDALQETAAQLKLRHLTFELQPPVLAGHVETSRMTLQVGLLHEGQLLRLFAQLSARAPALLWVRRCTLERSDPGELPWQPETDNLRADCLVEWRVVRAQ